MNGWKISTLEQVTKFIDYRGKTPKKIEAGLRLITAKNVKKGYLQREPMEFVDPNIYESWMTRGIPKKGDVLFTTEAPLGNVAQLDTDEKVVFAQRIIIMCPNKRIVDGTFLKYLLLSGFMQKKIHDQGTGATAKGIKSKLLKKIEIAYPPLEEQKRIVAILDEAFEGIDKAIENTEKNLANAREIFESYLNSIFCKIQEISKQYNLINLCDPERGITYGVIKLGKENVNGIPCLRTSNVRWLHIDTSFVKKIDPKLSEEYSRTILQSDEVLVNVRGTLGGVAVVPLEMKGWNISREVAIVPVDTNKVNPFFVAYWIGTSTSQKWLTGVQTG